MQGEATPPPEDSMAFEERALRQLLASPYGNGCILTLMDAIESGQTVAIHLADGATLLLSEKRAAHNALRDTFGWKPAR